MTPEIDKPEGGPELDALIAEKVMEWTPQSYFLGPPFSTNIAAAWTVVEKLWAAGKDFDLENFNQPGGGQGWRARFMRTTKNQDTVIAFASTAPLAICRAALKAVINCP